MSTQEKLYRWYVLTVVSGAEDRFVRELQESLEKKNFDDDMEEVFVPSKKITNSQGKKSEKKIFPGYIFFKSRMSLELMVLIQSLGGFLGFLGGEKPIPLSDREFESMAHAIEEDQISSEKDDIFDIGDTVTIMDGPFLHMDGIVHSVDEQKKRVVVHIHVFGRNTPAEISFESLKKKM